jgi:MFS family permease
MRQASPTKTGWFGPVLATVLLQFIGTFTLFFMPTVAPLMAAEFGWRESMIGYLASLTMLGSMTFLMVVAPLIYRAGPIRSIQLGLGFCVFAFGLLFLPIWVAPVVASLLIGLSYGPAVPASSQILQRFSPPQHRSLLFSIKQSGGALGGVFGGLTLPAVAAVGGWRGTVLFAIVLVVVFAAMVQPLRERTDDQRDRQMRLNARSFLSLDNLARPVLALRSVPGLLSYALGGGLLGITQGCWNAFLVTFLVTRLDYTLAGAGAIFAIMQAATIGGRVVMGWVSDRLGSGVAVMRIVSVATFLLTGILAFASPVWPYWLIVTLALLSGVGVNGWNGVNLSEVTSRVPRHFIGEASAGSIVIVMGGHIVGPSAFAVLLSLAERFDVTFLAAGTVALLALPFFGRLDRPSAAVDSRPPLN